MSEIMHPLRMKYTREHVKKTTNCPGCGNGIIVQAILRAIDELGMDMDEFAFVSGIGCSAWIPSPLFNADTLHTTHGRPIAFATGVKLGKPELNVVVASGDGDLAAIGGNHLIHAARRNIGITVILVNNGIYAMTGGQTAPTTPRGVNTTTNPYGTLESVFDISSLVLAAGAPFVARWTTYHPRQITSSLKKAFTSRGFSFIEIISQCPVQYGKVTKSGSALDLLKHYKKDSIKIDKARTMDPESLKGKIVVGEFVNEQKPELSAEWTELKARVMEGRS
ncbi:MAG: thiamine pyrophosphate-dependent enzyme [Desulfobacteraceae bacterium]|nr:thiamine pyrophosphate-dependent enzyme [Desulfobacteraceae bacterium]